MPHTLSWVLCDVAFEYLPTETQSVYFLLELSVCIKLTKNGLKSNRICTDSFDNFHQDHQYIHIQAQGGSGSVWEPLKGHNVVSYCPICKI